MKIEEFVAKTLEIEDDTKKGKRSSFSGKSWSVAGGTTKMAISLGE